MNLMRVLEQPSMTHLNEARDPLPDLKRMPPWSLDTTEDDVAHHVNLLLSYWQAYENHFQGNTERLQRDYFVFLN